MKRLVRDRLSRGALSVCAVLLVLVSVCAFLAIASSAQVATADLRGSVTDPSGALVPGANVTLTNVNTGVRSGTISNDSGDYAFVNVLPGLYVLEVAKQGFSVVKQPQFHLEVNQSATINVTLRVGATNTTVQVSAQGVQLETATAELGTVIGEQQVNDLPLNGRNFTQLLLLSPGNSPANQSPNSSGNWLVPYGNVTIPAVSGQNNMSNMFLLDGTVNFGGIRDTYGIAPVIDDISEFKVQSHNDEARFGQVVGGIVNIVTKSGTNQLHGDLWEFLRNDVFDATPYFGEDKTPLKQNQFGAAVGGPVLLPHYNGRNRTFFYSSYEGFRNHTAANSLGLTPSAGQLEGDFSDLTGLQIYNPYSTVVQNDGSVVRQPFMCDGSGNPLPTDSNGIQASGTACNKMPSNLLNPTTVDFATTFFPAPVNTGNPAFNWRNTTPNVITSNQISERIDEVIRNNDRLYGHYSGWWQSTTGSGGFPSLLSKTDSYTYNLSAHWTHTFGNSTILDVTFGRTSGEYDLSPQYVNVPDNFLQQSGFAQYFYDHPSAGEVIPSMFLGGGYVGGNDYQARIHWADVYDYRGELSKIRGRHLFTMGASLSTNGWWQPFNGSEDDFDAFQTSDGNGNDGNALASMMLGIPTYAEVDNVYSYLHGGKVIGTYFQDQWRVTPRLTLNMGLRYDLTINPREGQSSNGSNITGDIDYSNGTYILQVPAPACSPTQGTPCIPGGTLPAHVVIAKNGKISRDVYDNIQPRFGFAYRLGDKTVVRGAIGEFFDNWAAVTFNQSNNTQAWPNTAFIGADGINLTNPEAFATDPFNLGSGSFSSILPSPTPWTQSYDFFAPYLPNARSLQYNIGVQQELWSNSSITVNYVGSRDTRLADEITGNAALTPGPGDPTQRSPYPYMPQEGYYSAFGNSSYNGLQISAHVRSHQGLTGQVSYTWSKVTDIGCDGYFTGCSVQDPYHPGNDRGVASFDQPHVFSASWVYPLPFGTGQRWNSRSRVLNGIVGGWQLNGIVSLASGMPYDVEADNSIPNTNNFWGSERANLVSKSVAGASVIEPINTAAFAVPDPFTFGNMARNSLRSDWRKDLDLSLFRQFHMSESRYFEFRAEAFNATNTPTFAVPDNFITDPNFGLVSSTNSTERQLQLALKFYF